MDSLPKLSLFEECLEELKRRHIIALNQNSLTFQKQIEELKNENLQLKKQNKELLQMYKQANALLEQYQENFNKLQSKIKTESPSMKTNISTNEVIDVDQNEENKLVSSTFTSDITMAYPSRKRKKLMNLEEDVESDGPPSSPEISFSLPSIKKQAVPLNSQTSLDPSENKPIDSSTLFTNSDLSIEKKNIVFDNGSQYSVIDLEMNDETTDNEVDQQEKSKTPKRPFLLDNPKQKFPNTFKFVEVSRKKADREKLPGHECDQCQKFYDAISGNGKHKFDRKKFVNDCSRHKHLYSPPSTPPEFWEVSFPDTETQN